MNYSCPLSHSIVLYVYNFLHKPLIGLTFKDFPVFKSLKGRLEFGDGCIAIFDTLGDVDVQLAQSGIDPTIQLDPLWVIRVTSNSSSGLQHTSKFMVSTGRKNRDRHKFIRFINAYRYR